MTCIIDGSKSKIVREKGVWVVDGKYRVKDLSECQFKESMKEARVIVQSTEQAPSLQNQGNEQSQSPSVTHSESLPTIPVAQEAVQKETIQMESLDDVDSFMKLAGDNVWLVGVALLFGLVKRYLDIKQKSDHELKKEIDDRDKKTRDDLNGECKNRQAEAIRSIEDKFANLQKEIREELKNSKEITSTIKIELDEIKRKQYESDLAEKFKKKYLDEDEDEEQPRRGRPKKQAP